MLTLCFVQMMDNTADIQHDEQYPENVAMEDPAAAVQHNGMNEMGELPLSHAVREVCFWTVWHTVG